MRNEPLQFNLTALTDVADAVRTDWESLLKVIPVKSEPVKVPSPFNTDSLALVDYEDGLFKLGSSPIWQTFDLDRLELDAFDEDLRAEFSKTLDGFEGNASFRGLLFRSGTKVLKRFARRLKRLGPGHLTALAIREVMSDVVGEIMERQQQKYSLTWRMRSRVRRYLSAVLGLCARFVYGTSFGREVRREGRATLVTWVSYTIQAFRE